MSDSVEARLVRIETKLDTALAGQRDQEGRIRALERWQAYALGIAAAVGVAISLAVGWIRDTLRGG